MNTLLETFFFWIAFSIISSLVLRYFYFSKNVKLARKLRAVAGVLIAMVFVLLFFPWFPEARGGPTGWGVILQGDVPMVVLAGLLFFTLATLFTPRWPVLSKIGILTHIVATLFLFGLMIYTFPNTITLKFRDTAPIFAIMILLTNNLILLLLWHQLQKNKKV